MTKITFRFIKTVVVDKETNQVLSTEETVETNEGSSVVVNKPKPETSKKKEKEVVDVNESPIIKLQDNKLVLNPASCTMLGASPGDRICVSFIQNEDLTFIPVLGTQEKMGDHISGNKLTKSLTVSYKGKQFTTLNQYGSNFNLELLEDGTAKMIDTDHQGLEDIKESELIPVPEVIPEETSLSDSDFIDKLSEQMSQEPLENTNNNITFDFQF